MYANCMNGKTTNKEDNMNKSKAALAQAVTAAACSVIGTGMYNNTPPVVSYDDNPRRSKGARAFKHKKERRRAADKSRRLNRGR